MGASIELQVLQMSAKILRATLTAAVSQNSYKKLINLCKFTPDGDWVQPMLSTA